MTNVISVPTGCMDALDQASAMLTITSYQEITSTIATVRARR